MLALGLLLLVGALVLSLQPQPTNHDLPDMSAVMAAGLLFVGTAAVVYAGAGLLALRLRRAWLGKSFLVLAALVPVAIAVVMLGDVREEASASELGWATIVLPLVAWIVCVLSTVAVRELGIDDARWGRAVLGAAIALATLVAATVVTCNLARGSRATDAMAMLHPGMSWAEVVRTAGAVCPMSRAEVMAGWLWLRCPATAPPACSCVPVSSWAIELRFDEQKLARWDRRLVLTLPLRQ